MTAVAIVTRTADGRDSDGNTATTITFRVVDALYAPAGATESTGNGRDQVISQPTVYLETGEQVGVNDAVVLLPGPVVDVGADGWPVGDRYEVDGVPVDWQSPWDDGWQPGVEVKLRKVAG